MVAVSIQEAAERLGISADTIRRRLRKGEMAGHQEQTAQGFRWRVDIADNGHKADQDTGRENGHRQDHTSTAMEELVAMLQAQVQAQGEELESRRREVQELHVLLQQAQAALPAPADRQPSWWRRWWSS